MNLNFSFEVFIQTRKAILEIVENEDIETLNIIPSGFNNNLIWNFGHVVVTPQMLCYKKTGTKTTISEDLIDKYKKGSKPEAQISGAELVELKSLLFESIHQLERDYYTGIFQSYYLVINSLDMRLDTIEKAIHYCSAHDNLHLGYMQALKRAIKQ